VVLLSDLHFDPFLDPGKFARLQSASIAEWPAILSAPETAGRDAAWDALHAACGPRGPDTSLPLLQAALTAAHARQPHPAFVAVPGDLMAHEFECRFNKLVEKGKGGAANGKTGAAAYSDFAAKTTAFVVGQVRHAFAGTPVYFALGNNDSGCGDYKESAGSAYLDAAQQAFAMPGVKTVADDLGDYTAALPAPLLHARIIVLQDLFESRKAANCNGKQKPASAEAQVAWLRAQLGLAREAHERVWVMAHIPPGVDVYSTVHPYLLTPQMLCTKSKPSMFMGNESLADALTEASDVIALAVFGHSHADELRLLARGDHRVPVKLVPSVSPVNGNHSSFTVAQVDPRTATLEDYAVVTSQGPLLAPTKWEQTYSFRDAYGAKAFTAEALAPVLAGMRSHVAGKSDSAAALAYERWFFPGDTGLYGAGLDLFWPAYSCSLVEDRAAEYWQCACPKDSE
jgi:sphingomyelin phosphodiesterase acid-like 3